MKKVWLLFISVTLLNGIIFLFRDYFSYHPYSTKEELYAPCDENCREKWNDFLLPYSNEAIAEAKAILNPLRIDTTSTIGKLKLIGTHLRNKFGKQGGYPSDTIHRADPLDQYKILSNDSSQKIWCGTWAQLISFFGWSQGIVNRNIEIMQPGDRHILTEYYVSELRTWAMIDLSHDIVLAQKTGKPLNTIAFLDALKTPDSIEVLTGSGEFKPLTQLPGFESVHNYYRKEFDYFYYHNTHLAIVYSPAAKFKRYFLPDSWYEIYSFNSKSNWPFYVKLVFMVTWLILVSLILIKRFHD